MEQMCKNVSTYAIKTGKGPQALPSVKQTAKIKDLT